jgi:hypothetical protein
MLELGEKAGGGLYVRVFLALGLVWNKTSSLFYAVFLFVWLGDCLSGNSVSTNRCSGNHHDGCRATVVSQRCCAKPGLSANGARQG